MPTSVWGGPEPGAEELYPAALLKHLLKPMLVHFGAQGACIALYDESVNQMRVHAHVRLNDALTTTPDVGTGENPASAGISSHSRRVTINLLHDTQTAQGTPFPPQSHVSPTTQEDEELKNVSPQQCELFAVGTSYPAGRDLIGITWQKNEVYTIRHEDYCAHFHANRPMKMDVVPGTYLAFPIRESTLVGEMRERKQQAHILGVIVLYQLAPGGSSFYKKRGEVLQCAERIAMYLQNDRLQHAQRRTAEYLKLLQGISTAFPTSVKLSDLVENIYGFATRIVDVSCMLLTLYDRDTDRLYDVFAICDGRRIEGLAERPLVKLKEERPTWWRVTQHERHTLLLSPSQNQQQARDYHELLTGIWGDQRQVQSFLLLPMKMFNRVIGALCLASNRPNAYHAEEIQVLETMTQIVTVSIENAKLYERDRHILLEAKQREEQLAAINSALQSISSVLNVTELLNNLVESVAKVLRVEMCVFFEPSSSGEELFAHALYAPSSVQMIDDGSGMPVITPPKKGEPDQIIGLIQLPFKNTFLEQRVNEGFFYVDPPQLEELAQKSNEGGAIFLRETNIHHLLVIPMSYQKEFIGFLAVPTPNENRIFRPKDVGTLLAICAQAASAVRNAHLFEQREEALAELERMSKLKDEFLVTASHELRTPLTAISGYSSQLKRRSARATPQQILRFATQISIATQQLGDLVASMTEAAQLGAVDKNLALHIEPVQLLSAAEIAINMLTLNAEQHVTLDINPAFWINGDGPRVRQVLTNLLENAAKYSPHESQIYVTTSTMKLAQVEDLLSEDQIDHALLLEKGETPIVLVRVKDQGEGILPDDQQRIFEKFVRAPRSLTTPVRGTGLGLFICRRFVEAMHGKLWLEQSVPNEGSTFSFYLPRVEPPIETVGVDAIE